MDAETPRARRLNRNAAILALVAAGAMLLVMALLVTSAPEIGDGDAGAQPLAADPAPQRPSFLDRAPVPPPVEDAGGLGALLGAPPAEPSPSYTSAPVYGAGDPYALAYPIAPALAEVRVEARERALAAGILAGEALRESAPSVAVGMGGPGTSAYSVVAGRSRTLAADVQSPGEGYEVPSGTVIHAVLLSAVRSDAPGEAVAQVAHDVYDRSMRVVLIPRATRLLGRPAGSTVMGQQRLSLVWDRLVLPDGRTVLLPDMESQDAAGAGGLEAAVDHRTGSVLRSAVLLSLVGAGAQLSQPQQSASFGQAPSAGQVAAGALGQQLGTVSAEMIRRGMDLRPTLSLEAGERVDVLLTADLPLEPYR